MFNNEFSFKNFYERIIKLNNSLLNIREDDFYIGIKNAPITIIEYHSMSASHCADFHNDTLPQLKTEFIDTGKVRIIFRDFPLNYPLYLAA